MPKELPPHNYKLILEYDGSAYLGWQQQKDGQSIEAHLLDALQSLTRERPSLMVAGRTDAGVHAAAQVVSFRLHKAWEARRLAPGLNNFLPNDISVHTVEEASSTFNARTDSTSKRYAYRIYNGPQPAALELHRAWQLRRPLDVEAMRDAARHFIGHLDFEAFRSAHCDADHARRHMYEVDIEESPRPPVGHAITITFHANAYCRHMCRILAGTLGEVGLGQRTPEDVHKALTARDRALAGQTAPPQGLTLLEVRYDSAP